MLTDHLESALCQVEQRVAALSQALVGGEPSDVEATSDQLRAVSLAFSEFFKGVSAADRLNPQLAQRLHRVSGLLASQRQGLARHAVTAQRALSILVPAATRASTYGPGQSGAGVYGGKVKQTGAFTVLAA